MKKDLLLSLRGGEELTLRQQTLLALQLSIPAILAQVSSIAMQYIDSSMVGHLGREASAAIGLVASSTWLRCPLAQAEPAETQMPRSCNMLMEFWVGTPGTETDRMCGASCAPVSTTPGSAERRSESAVSSAASRA